jgi:hypothetical protein
MASERSAPSPRNALEPPGLFALNYGRQTALVTLIAHVLYGAVLGIVALSFANVNIIASPDVIPNGLLAWTLLIERDVDYDEFVRPSGSVGGDVGRGAVMALVAAPAREDGPAAVSRLGRVARVADDGEGRLVLGGRGVEGQGVASTVHLLI